MPAIPTPAVEQTSDGGQADPEDVEDVAPIVPGSIAHKFPANREIVKKRRTAFDRIRRDLSDDELGQTGVQKLLLHQFEEVSERAGDMESFRTRFHEAEKLLAVAESRLQANAWTAILEGLCFTLGGALLGFSKNVNAQGVVEFDPLQLAIGFLLLVGSIIGRFLGQRKKGTRGP